MQEYETAWLITEKVEKIASKVADIKTDLFKPVTYKELGQEKTSWVYPNPLEATEEINIYGEKYTRIDRKMAIVNLDLAEQACLYELVSDRLGFRVTFPSLALNLEAAYNPETRLYKDNFLLKPFWVYNGILARKEDNGKVDVRRVVGAKFADEFVVVVNTASQIVQDKEGREFPPKSTEETVLKRIYILEPAFNKPPLQAELPTKFGKFDDFDNVAPTDKDLKNEGKGYWTETYWDDENLSTVWSCWDPRPRQGLLASADQPLIRNDEGALAVATDENPKK